jgi:hypothetical protein
MSRTIVIALATIALAAGLWWMLPHAKQHPRNESPDHSIGALPPPVHSGRGVGALPRGTTKDIDLSLDRIAGASVQEISDLLAGKSPKEIALLVQQLQALKFSGLSNTKIDLIFKAWAHLAPHEALNSAVSLKSEWARSRALGAILEGASPDATAALVNSINQLGDGAISSSLKQELISKGIRKWSETDPAGAASFLESMSSLQFPPETWRQVAENWAAQDPRSAIDWIQKQTSPEILRTSMQGMISGWWQKDPQAAQSYAEQHTDTLAGQQSASIVANRIAASDPAEAAKWASQLTNENARQMSELTIAAGWAANDPSSAAKWAASLPPEEQDAAYGAIASVWAKNDPQAAGEWLNSLSGSARDTAVGSYASSVAPVDPATALSWALSASNASIRDESARHIATEWLARDPAAARAWIQQSNLSDSDKATLLGAPPTSPP